MRCAYFPWEMHEEKKNQKSKIFFYSVGPRGLRPGHLLPLIEGALEDADAMEAWGRLLTLGSLYVD